jgi:hypothetical protein
MQHLQQSNQLDIESDSFKICFKYITYPQNFRHDSMWHAWQK